MQRFETGFDVFMIRYLGIHWENGMLDESVRRDAYREFISRIGDERPASLPTIRRWFGIHGYRGPTRRQIFRIAFALQLDVDQTGEFLLEGICEPYFQINDYEEIIAMYCLENHFSYKRYLFLLEEYEGHLEQCMEISRESNTQWLFQQFEQIKNYSEQEFLCWMAEHNRIFKGYSRTVQEYLEKYRMLVVEYMRDEMKEQLELLLSETGYEKWSRRYRKEESGDKIRKYVKKGMKEGTISEHLGKNILELCKLVYSHTGKNTMLLSEFPVSSKYLSDLFNIPVRNEMTIRAKEAVAALKEMDRQEPCPDYMRELIDEYSGHMVTVSDAGEAYDWLREFLSEGKRRRLIVGRGDLLPLILYVVQQKYYHQLETEKREYQKEEAVRMFHEMADATMIACNMMPLDERYRLDGLLLSCFQENEMIEYPDAVTEAI